MINQNEAAFRSNEGAPRPKRNFYDFAEMKAIPIVAVAQDLNLELQTKGGNPWCKVRQENEASVLLHSDRNTFYDFGINKGGDVIEFVGYVLDLDRSAAVEQLASMYNIQPKNDQRNSDEMSLWDYECIGIAGDLATKNFRYDIDRLPTDALISISDRYAMSMNELRTAYPKTYASILSQTAIPYVAELRNNYLLSVWSLHELVSDIGNPGMFQVECRRGVFRNQIEELKRAERSLCKAARGTKLKVRQPSEYDPMKDLEALASGKLKPRMGTLSYDEMQKRSQETGSNVKYVSMDYTKYGSNFGLLNFPHTAFLRSGKVVVGFLERDFEDFKAAIRSQPTQETNQEPANRPDATKEGER